MKSETSPIPKVIVFELSLGLVGALIAKAAGIRLDQQFVAWPLEPGSTGSALNSLAVGVVGGLVATLPMLLLLAVGMKSQLKALKQLRRQVQRLVGQVFSATGLWQFAAVSVAAGLGEELLFRGALQPLAVKWLSVPVGILATSLLFGLAHAVSRIYFIFATVVGLYLGWLAQWSEGLLVPIVVHSCYDFVALVWLSQSRKNKRKRSE